MSLKRKQLLSSAKSYCDAFKEKKDVNEIMSHFSTTHATTLIEHGDPVLAPFLGKTYSGKSSIEGYFNLIASLLSYEDMDFYEFLVDADVAKVAVKGEARFTWISTGQSWKEDIAYMLDFDDEGKITDCEIWADSGCVYLARIGDLDRVKES